MSVLRLTQEAIDAEYAQFDGVDLSEAERAQLREEKEFIEALMRRPA